MAVYSKPAAAQEYSYSQYNINDGLAGSTVYCSTQDKDGFMWFGTETGLSRFDGSHFKNYSTDDGLPDNEILKIFCDSRGRLWLSLFKKSVCYYFEGKIHNQDNDSLLKKIHLTGIAWQVCEDNYGNILVMEQNVLHKISRDGKVTDISKINGIPADNFLSIGKSTEGNFWVLEKESLYELKQDNSLWFKRIIKSASPNLLFVKVSPSIIACKTSDKINTITDLRLNKDFYFRDANANISFDIINDSLISFNSSDSTILYDLNSHRPVANLMPGKFVSSVFMDNENNFWCTTLGSGIFRISSLNFRNLYYFDENRNRIGVTSLIRNGNNIIAGSYDNYFCLWNPQSGYKRNLKVSGDNKRLHRFTALQMLGSGEIVAGSDAAIYKVSAAFSKQREQQNINVKSIFKINDDSFLIANKMSLLLFNPKSFRITDTLLKERTTTAFYYKDTFYAGTLDGLMLLDKKKNHFYPGKNNPLLYNKITAITLSPTGVLWMATYSSGVIAYKDGKVIAHITEGTGLTSNICRCLFLDGNNLWVGTDKGLNKIDISKKKFTITKFTSSDALASDIINAVLVHNGIVYTGTPEGITYFDEANISLYSQCSIRVTQMFAGADTIWPGARHIKISHQSNDVSFEYSGISFKSAGDITYYYRLIGSDSLWQTTKNSPITFNSLSSGKYQFQVFAENKFGVTSNIIKIPFEVEQHIWELPWVRILLLIFILLLLWNIARWRIRVVRKKSDEKISTMQHINMLEQMSLQAQMNPHFIFNSLNSIQQYVIDKDVEGANKFITDFSKLIRKTLEFSARQRISISEEMEYISTYLHLERERLANSFIYEIKYDPDIR
ncbi:MAG TPA: histidine kinase, partial [Chitinophagaceae bacterium]|nr:histidine kinase [Chitinophagaceae bacterium]